MKKKIKAVLEEMAEFEKQWDAKWAVDEETGKYLYHTIMEMKPSAILELGTWRGASAIYMGAALQELGQGILVTVDRDEFRSEQAKENIQKAGLSESVEVVIEDIHEFLAHHKQVYDLIFIDAAKKPQGEWLDLLIKNNSHKDTVFIVDDVITMKDKMNSLYEYVESNKNITSKILDIDDGLMVIKFN